VSLQRWKIEQMAQLQRDLEHVFRCYEGQCLEAASHAPKLWREYWTAEAKSASLLRQSMLRKVQMFVEFADGRNVETLASTGEE
jgi:hypothetical protein